MLKPASQKSSCLLLNTRDARMLVPRNLVAEVLRHSFVEYSESPDSGLAFFEWRGCQVPLINAVASANDDGGGEDYRVVVFYGLKDARVLPFYGMTVEGGPQLLQVADDDLEEVTEAALHPSELMKIQVNGAQAFIPKVDYFENLILKRIH